MKNSIIIKVNELALCDHFYRDVLQIGEVEILSSFCCSYRISPESSLYLVKSDAKFLEHASSAVFWSFETSDMKALENRLSNAGFTLDKEKFLLGCDEFFRGNDPEGNPFFVKEEKK